MNYAMLGILLFSKYFYSSWFEIASLGNIMRIELVIFSLRDSGFVVPVVGRFM